MHKNFKINYISASFFIAVIVSFWLSYLYVRTIFNAHAKFDFDIVEQLYFDMSAVDLDSLLHGGNIKDVDAYKDQNIFFKNYANEKGNYQYFVYNNDSGELESNQVLHIREAQWLAPYGMLLNGSLVSSIYLITNDYKIIGLTEQQLSVPVHLHPLDKDVKKTEYWESFSACFNPDPGSVCSTNPYVTNQYTDMLSKDDIITLLFPYKLNNQFFGVIGFDIRTKILFERFFDTKDVIKPTSFKITDMNVACNGYTICFNKEISLLDSRHFTLFWEYNYVDFIQAIVSTHRFIYTFQVMLVLMSFIYFLITLWGDRQSRDGLTGVYSRKAIYNVKRHGRYSYVLMMDIDNFKAINDTYGHDIGDKVLVAFANHLRKHTRSDDLLCRWGGEEFVVMYRTGADENCMLDIVRRLWSSPVTILDSTLNITFSGGLVRMGKDISSSINAADRLLYQVKRNGKNNVMLEINGEHSLLMAKSFAGPLACTGSSMVCTEPLLCHEYGHSG